MISGLSFKSLIPFIFVYGLRQWSSFVLLHVTVQFPQYHWLKKLSFPPLCTLGYSRVLFKYLKCYPRSLYSGWYVPALSDLRSHFSSFSFLFAGPHPENTQLSFWPKTQGNTFIDFWALFTCRVNSLVPWRINPDIFANLTSDVCFLFPESLSLCVGSTSLYQKSGVTVEPTSSIFFLSRVISLYCQFLIP